MPEFVIEFGRKIGAVDDRLDAAAFHRNFEPLLAVLRRVLSDRSGHVLEIGSGTGQHVVGFAAAMPALTWQPTDLNPNHLKSIEAWRQQSGVANIAPPFALDATDPETWLGGDGRPPVQALAAIVSMNVIHIAPWSVCEGIMQMAGRDLSSGGLLVLSHSSVGARTLLRATRPSTLHYGGRTHNGAYAMCRRSRWRQWRADCV